MQATALVGAKAVQWLLDHPKVVLTDDAGQVLVVAVEHAAVVEVRANPSSHRVIADLRPGYPDQTRLGDHFLAGADRDIAIARRTP